MSDLAHIGDGLRALQRDAVKLDESLERIAARDLAQLRAHFQQRASGHGPGAAEARRRLALVAEAERRLREGRAQLQRGAVQAQRWLDANGAAGEHGGGGAGAPPPPPDSADGALSPSDAVYAAVHRANAQRIAGEPFGEAMDALGELLERLDAQDGGAYRMAAAWQGEQEGDRNAYDEQLRDPEPGSTYVVEGPEGHLFQFETDARGRTVRARTTLRLLDQPRSGHLQDRAKRAKGGDADDDGGHVLANRFGGPSEEINVVPQDWFANQRGPWRALEREWQGLVASGFDVELEVEPVYVGESARPVALVVRWAFRHREAPQAFEWVKDVVRIDNDHAAGSRGSPGMRRR